MNDNASLAAGVAVAQRITDTLTALGDHADGVAATLLQRGCKGRPGDSLACPVAVSLTRACPDVGLVVVSLSHVAIHANQVRVMVPLPPPVRAFMAGFDAMGHYPELAGDPVLPDEGR